MRGIGRFISNYWRGVVPVWASFLGCLLGLHLGMALLLYELRGAGDGLVVAAALLQAVVLIWQCVGMFRAADQSFRGFGGAQLATLSYAAILGVAGSTFYQISGLLAFGQTTSPVAVAAPVTVTTDAAVIRLQGEITLKEFSVVERLLSGEPGFRLLVLHSVGGSIPAARGIARLVEQAGLDTVADGNCFSACTLVFMAGDHRTMTPGSRLGFHSYRTGRVEQGGHLLYGDVGSEQLRDRQYFARRGLSGVFLERIFDAAPDEMWQPSEDELRAAGVLTE
jgi:hypothetical protein